MSASPSRLSLLLPAYLSGTLGDADRRWVEQQLATSADARAELEELKVLKAGLQAHWNSELAPSPSARARVMAAIGAPARKEVKPGFGERIGSALSSLFAPKWVPAAALAVIVLQFGLLVSMNGIRGPGTDGGVIGKGLDDFPTHFTLMLKPDAKLSDVTALLKDLRAEIVSGPNAAGAYVIGVRTDKPALINEKLTLARSRGDVVASIDIKPPP
jgi:hypothetical protein